MDHGPARFQASGGGRITESMTSVASYPIDASFCLVFKKINATNFVAHPLLQNFFHLKFYLMKFFNTKNSRFTVGLNSSSL